MPLRDRGFIDTAENLASDRVALEASRAVAHNNVTVGRPQAGCCLGDPLVDERGGRMGEGAVVTSQQSRPGRARGTRRRNDQYAFLLLAEGVLLRRSAIKLCLRVPFWRVLHSCSQEVAESNQKTSRIKSLPNGQRA